MALYKRLGSVFGWTGAAAIAAALVMFTTAPARADVDFRVILGVPGTVGVFLAPDHHHRPPHWRQYRYKRDYHNRQRWVEPRRDHHKDWSRPSRWKKAHDRPSRYDSRRQRGGNHRDRHQEHGHRGR